MSASFEYPEYFARFYDVIYKHLRNEVDHDYFLGKILTAKGPVLEVGVGTGRFFIEALNKGADIYGIDISQAMIDVLKRKLPVQEHYRISTQDVCKLQSDKKYNLIIAPFRVFMHLLTVEQQLKALATVYEHLNPSGTFIFDLFVPNLQMLAEGINNVQDFDGEYEPGMTLQRFTSMTVDPVNQISHVTFSFIWKEGKEGFNYTWNTELRLFFRFELEHLLYRSKFKDYHIYGDFSGHELTEDSKEFVIICKR
jgi:ubiquinone/menaquinone biosynthesis C-methylase UbiE